jgi:FKBP-type peptidyl-prolyl cis-trans isomerase 2
MPIAKDTVVSIEYELFDAAGTLIEKTKAPIKARCRAKA